MKRKPISKFLRFKIFARDNFTCRYCGRQSDVTPLAVDHIHPVSQGGTNDDENLITSCVDCNAGKGAKTLAQTTPTEADRLRLTQERNEQVESALAARAAAKARSDLRQEVCNYICSVRGGITFDANTLGTITNYVNEFGPDLVFSWIDSAARNLSLYTSDSKFGRYISGCRRTYLAENT